MLLQAHEIDPDSPEPEQASASLRHELGDVDAALQLLRSSMRKWWRPGPDEQPAADGKSGAENGEQGKEACASDKNVQDGSGSDDGSDDGEDLPSYEFRLEACKLLIELDNSTDVAVEVRDLYSVQEACRRTS